MQWIEVQSGIVVENPNVLIRLHHRRKGEALDVPESQLTLDVDPDEAVVSGMGVPRGVVVHEDHVIEGVRRKGGEDILRHPFVNGFPAPKGHEQAFVGRIARDTVVDITMRSSIEGQRRIRNVLLVWAVRWDGGALLRSCTSMVETIESR